MKKNLLAATILLAGFSYAQNSGINTTNPQATLDVVGVPADATKLDGVIAPRLTGVQLRAKLYTPAQTGAVVYITTADTAPAGQTINVTTTGYYFFDGSVWRLITPADWHITGNAGTDPAINFIGTTDDKDVVFKRNGVPAGLLNSDSQNTSWGGVGANPNNAGAFNTANGYQALYSNTIGIDNTATGYAALGGNTTGESNTAVGYQALGSNATGNYNTALGYRAGDSGNFNIQGTGSNNILIGYNAQPSSYAVSNEVTLGNPNNNVYRMYAASWTNASDRKLKHDIAEIPVGLNFVKALKPVSYIYNSSTTATKTLGFVAQDVQEAMRANTLGKEYGLVNQLDKDHLGLNTTELIPVLTKAIQEQQTQIETQQKQIEMHQKQIEAQNALIEKLGKRLETLERKP